MKKSVLALLVTAPLVAAPPAASLPAALSVAVAPEGAASTARPAQPAEPFWVRRPCPAEDSNNCYWDAEARGDRRGHSFVARALPDSDGLVCVFYTQRAFARQHDFCRR